MRPESNKVPAEMSEDRVNINEQTKTNMTPSFGDGSSTGTIPKKGSSSEHEPRRTIPTYCTTPFRFSLIIEWQFHCRRCIVVVVVVVSNASWNRDILQKLGSPMARGPYWTIVVDLPSAPLASFLTINLQLVLHHQIIKAVQVDGKS